jgi:sugar lactone lactonase YvrE
MTIDVDAVPDPAPAPKPARPPVPRWIRAAKHPATTPPALTGPWAPDDTRIDECVRYPLPSGSGPEDVVVDPAGRVVAGGDDGHIWRWPADPDAAVAPQLLADTGGRPLGLEIDPRDGSLVVCDAVRGLLRITEDGAVTDLADQAAGAPIVFCNNAAVARDGTVFFTDSSDRYPITVWKRDLLEHRPNGRLLAWSPESGRAELIRDGLYFPNGIALNPDESALLVCETSSHRLLRIPLAGGEPIEVLDLPAYPDNMSSVGDGTYWIALPSPRLPIEERLLPHPHIRQLAALLPDRLQPQPKRHGIVALVDADGAVLRTLHAPTGWYRMITGVRQHGNDLWLGSLTEGSVARLDLATGSSRP